MKKAIRNTVKTLLGIGGVLFFIAVIISAPRIAGIIGSNYDVAGAALLGTGVGYAMIDPEPAPYEVSRAALVNPVQPVFTFFYTGMSTQILMLNYCFVQKGGSVEQRIVFVEEGYALIEYMPPIPRPVSTMLCPSVHFFGYVVPQ